MSSETNQPDFVTNFDESLSKAFGGLVKATKAVGKLPQDISFHRTLDDAIDDRLTQASQRTLSMAGQLWQQVRGGSSKATLDIESVDDIAVKRPDSDNTGGSGGWDIGPGFRPIVDTVDTLLEKIDVGLDEVLRNPAHQYRQSAPVVSSVKATGGRRTDLKVVHAHNIERPQLLFRDTIDNSATTPFVWKIRQKHHAKVPLDYGLPSAAVADTPFGKHLQSMGIARPGTPSSSASGSNSPGKNKSNKEPPLDISKLMDAMSTAEVSSLASLPHPYEYEISNIDYPSFMFVDQEPIKPKDDGSTPFDYIDTTDGLNDMVSYLQSPEVKEIAIDLEHHSYRSFQGFTCLIQISSRSRDFIVDAIALRSELYTLNQVTADPSKIKVFHGAESDIVWLQRDFGVYVVGMFDTYHASKVLSMKHHSLAFLLKKYCDYEADKKYQLADWRIRPLPQEMVGYARDDTHYLLYVFDEMRHDLLSAGKRLLGKDVGKQPDSPHYNQLGGGIDVVHSINQPMEVTLQKSAKTCLNRYIKDGYDVEHGLGPGGWAVLLRKWKQQVFTPVELAVYRALHRWRDGCARDEDESPVYVLPNHMLFNLVRKLPNDVPSLLRSCTPTPPLVRLNANDLVMLIDQERKRAEQNLSGQNQLPTKEDVAGKLPVHTRFEDDDGVDGDNKDDVLTSELLASVSDMIAPVSGLFGDMSAKQEITECQRKAQETRANLVLTVAIPKHVFTSPSDQDETKDTEQNGIHDDKKRKVDEQEEETATTATTVQPPSTVVLSKTYGRQSHTPQQDIGPKKRKAEEENGLDLPKIALGDISSDDDASGDNEEGTANRKPIAKKPKKEKKKKAKVNAGDVKPFDYSSVTDNSKDAIGETVSSSSSKKNKKKKNKTNKKGDNFNPYSDMGSKPLPGLSQKPARPRVHQKSGNRSMTFKK